MPWANLIIWDVSWKARHIGLELTRANYSVAITLLQKRYGYSQITINAHYKELKDLPESPNQISKFIKHSIQLKDNTSFG